MSPTNHLHIFRELGLLTLVAWAMPLVAWNAVAQEPEDATSSSFAVTAGGDRIPLAIRELTERGLQYLMQSQLADGTWSGGQQGNGVTGLCLLALLSSGEDPNFGMYSSTIRKALRSIISSQNATTGYWEDSMYHHGFAMLALAEAYGAVDESDLWPADSTYGNQRSIGEALELGVRCALTSQSKNPQNAWRYSPDARDADTSVSGAVLVGLLAARNAGIEVPDNAIDKAIAYYTSMTSSDGSVAYAGGAGMGESTARSSITTLVLAIAKRKELPQYKATSRYIVNDSGSGGGNWEEYTRYYQAQALFQADPVAWEKWNAKLARRLKAAQAADGSIQGPFGPALSTSMSILALALNYKFLPIYER